MNDIKIKKPEIQLNAYAKINLSLYVLSRRDDGYHDIRSFMQGINIFDTLQLKSTIPQNYDFYCFVGKTGIYLCTNNSTIPMSEDNLAIKGIKAVLEAANEATNVDNDIIDGWGCVSVYIDKKLPVAAGIAGGSGNAAASMLGLNAMLGNLFSLRELMKIGLKVGADVPFSVMMNAYRNGDVLSDLSGLGEARAAAIVSGIGDVVEPTKSRDYHVLLFNPGVAVSTKEVYEAIDEELSKLPAEGRKIDDYLFHNDLELYTLARYGEAKEMEEFMREMLHADAVLMSGSGPTVAAYYTEQAICEADYAVLERELQIGAGWRYWKTESGGYD